MCADKNPNTVQYEITPFCLKVFPNQRDRYCIIILCPSDLPILEQFFQFILNGFIDVHIITAPYGGIENSISSKCLSSNFHSFINNTSFLSVEPKTVEHGGARLFQYSREFTDTTQSKKELKNKLAIIDLSAKNEFKTLHPDIIPGGNLNEPDWLQNHRFRSIVMPNMLLNNGNPEDAWSKNYSHSIWLASSFDQIPKIVLDNAHMTYILGVDLIKTYFEQKLRVQITNFNEHIIAISNTLQTNLQIMTIPPARFTANAKALTKLRSK